MNQLKHWESIFCMIIQKNNDEDFLIKIQTMDPKLYVWMSQDLTLTGQTLFVKALEGISKIVSASMLCVPQKIFEIVGNPDVDFYADDSQLYLSFCPDYIMLIKTPP